MPEMGVSAAQLRHDVMWDLGSKISCSIAKFRYACYFTVQNNMPIHVFFALPKTRVFFVFSVTCRVFAACITPHNTAQHRA